MSQNEILLIGIEQRIGICPQWEEIILVLPPNDSYWVSIYNAEIYLYTDSDGIDSNGYLFILGGNINIFSEGTGANEPIDHIGNFSLYNAEILGVGTGGLEFVHECIKKEIKCMDFIQE